MKKLKPAHPGMLLLDDFIKPTAFNIVPTFSRFCWCLACEEFRQELLAAAVERVGASHYGSERQEKAGFNRF
jgi:hypothetical protein